MPFNFFTNAGAESLAHFVQFHAISIVQGQQTSEL
jgi:hypothetical protein